MCTCEGTVANSVRKHWVYVYLDTCLINAVLKMSFKNMSAYFCLCLDLRLELLDVLVLQDVIAQGIIRVLEVLSQFTVLKSLTIKKCF